jgi:hypothetical protein
MSRAPEVTGFRCRWVRVQEEEKLKGKEERLMAEAGRLEAVIERVRGYRAQLHTVRTMQILRGLTQVRGQV